MKREFSITDVVKAEAIRLRVEAKDCEDVIRKSGRVMVEQGVVEERYIDAMIEVFKEMGPYIVVTQGVAIPHARPEDGAKKVGLALLTLKKPINFGHEENDPVRICIAFATPDKDQHLKILASLAKFLQNREDIEAITNARTPEEVIEILRSYEEV